jgi:tRNA(Ile)-lysidine synthase
VVVAVSGGLDSMTLLALLAREKAGGDDLEIVAAHFDHGARAREGADDGRFVAAVGDRWGARVVRGAGDAPGRARASGRGPMTAARELRYDFLCEVADDAGAWAIATAHQRDDRVETTLMRIVRGTSLDGLAGPGPIDEWRGTPVIRPLLPFSRAAIASWVRRAGVPYREDPSNEDPRYPRSRVRKEVLPLLRQLNPRIDLAVARLAEHAAADGAWLRHETQELLDRATRSRDDAEWTLRAAPLAQAPAALLGRAVVAAWAWSAPRGSAPPGAAWIEGVVEFVRGGRGGRLAAPGGGEIRRRGAIVVVRRAQESRTGDREESTE